MALSALSNTPAINDAARVLVAQNHGYLSAVAGFRLYSGDGASYRSLPHAQFALTVHCDDDWENKRCGAASSVTIGLAGLSKGGAIFQSRGAGAVIIAFLKPRAIGLIHRGWHSMRGQVVDAVTILGKSSARELAFIARSRRPLIEKTAAIARWLDLFCAGSPTLSRDGERVALAADMLTESSALSVHQLTAFIGTSRRQLENDFVKWIGLPPGRFRDAVRLEHTLAALTRNESLAHIAAEYGYADQSHMTRSIHARIGLTPLQIRRYARRSTAQNIGAALGGRSLVIDAEAANLQFDAATPHALKPRV